MSRLIRKIHSYSYGVLNQSKKPIIATIDVSKSHNMVHSTRDPKMTKVNS